MSQAPVCAVLPNAPRPGPLRLPPSEEFCPSSQRRKRTRLSSAVLSELRAREEEWHARDNAHEAEVRKVAIRTEPLGSDRCGTRHTPLNARHGGGVRKSYADRVRK